MRATTLDPKLIEDAVSGLCVGGFRRDGWTPRRVRLFLNSLARTGRVDAAVAASGLSRRSAYALRNNPRGRAFDLAWRAARSAAVRVAIDAKSRVLHGTTELIVRDGKVWGERHRFDNRLIMSALTRLDKASASLGRRADSTPQRVAQEFDAFVEALCEGDAAANAFLQSRGIIEAKADRCEWQPSIL